MSGLLTTNMITINYKIGEWQNHHFWRDKFFSKIKVCNLLSMSTSPPKISMILHFTLSTGDQVIMKHNRAKVLYTNLEKTLSSCWKRNLGFKLPLKYWGIKCVEQFFNSLLNSLTQISLPSRTGMVSKW